ncbi:hypothetical protein WJX84_012048 [Apatococcus fuscideae]|uniref:Uncharacterized protein n=1 Tax=Apatococcus fuscideae TaxID=2026836 RepID=A0AAW1T8U3_9CHLO
MMLQTFPKLYCFEGIREICSGRASMKALVFPVGGRTASKAGQRPTRRPRDSPKHFNRTVAAAAAAGETKRRGRQAIQGPTAEQVAAVLEAEKAEEAARKARRATRMGKDINLSPPEELFSPKEAFEATLPKFLVQEEGSPFSKLDFGVAGGGKEQWWGVQLDDSKHARRFTEYLDKQLEALQPPGSPLKLKHACDVWLPKRTIRAWSERTEKMGNRSEIWHEGVILLRTVMTNEISTIIQRSTAVAGWHKSDSVPGVDAQFPLPFTQSEVDDIQKWQDEKVVLSKEDVLSPGDSRLQPPKEMSPADDPRLVERVDLKTGQKKFIYRDEEADQRREEAKARRDAAREQEGVGADNRGGREQPQAASTQIGLRRGDARPGNSAAGAAESSVDLGDWNVGRNRRGRGPAPIRNTAIDWNVGPTPETSRGWRDSEPRADQSAASSSNWGSSPVPSPSPQPAAASAAPAGMFGGSGIFDLISNPVEKAQEDIAEAQSTEASEPEALSWQEATIENDGFPTSSTPQDRNQFWAGPRGPRDTSGLELKQPDERRQRRPAQVQSFRGRGRPRGSGRQSTDRWNPPAEDPPAKGWYTGGSSAPNPSSNDDDFWSNVSELTTAPAQSSRNDFWSRPIQPDASSAAGSALSADDFWSQPPSYQPQDDPASSSQDNAFFTDGETKGRGRRSQRGSRLNDNPAASASSDGLGRAASTDDWFTGASVSNDQPDGERRAGNWYTGSSATQPAAPSPAMEAFPTDPDPWGFLKGDPSTPAAANDGSFGDNAGDAGDNDPWGMNDRPLVDQATSQRGSRDRHRGPLTSDFH